MTTIGKILKRALVVAAVSILTVTMLTACGKETTLSTDTVVMPEIESIVEEPVTKEPEAEPTEEAKAEAVKDEADITPEAADEVKEVQELKVDLSRITAFPEAKTMYAVSNVNIRKGPSTEFEAIGMIKLGESVQVVGRDKDGWYEFNYKDDIAFASDDYLSEDVPVIPTPTVEAAADAAAQAADANAQAALVTQAAQAATSAKTVQAPAGVLIIGDSRCVMMREATNGGGCSWICQNSKGYNWLESTAIPQADEIVGKGTKVVICLGVNDVGNVNKYAALVNVKAAEWAARGAKTYYVSVNPVWENAYVTEEQVQYFNSQLVGQLAGIKWIDTHSYLMNSGYRLTDGLHYDNETSIRIFQTIIGSL